MRSAASNVKSLALASSIWHRLAMSEQSDAQAKERSNRLRDALRANLRRRKGQGRVDGPDLEGKKRPAG
jgi:hypothetical protein